MTDFTYGGANGGGVHNFHDDEGLHQNLTSPYTNPNTIEFYVQQDISSAQLLSPTMQHPTARPSTSQHQAVPLPYATAGMYVDSRTGNSYSRRPTNMRRSVSSQYSPTSSGQSQRNGSLQRPSRASFGNDSRPHAFEMTRAPSQYSNASIHQAAPQPNATQPHLDAPNFYPSTMPPSSSQTNPQYDTISATDLLGFGGVSDIIGRPSAEAEQEPEVFGQTNTSNGTMQFLAAFSQPPRLRLDSLVQFTSQGRLSTICSPHSDTPANRGALPSPALHHSPTLSPPPVIRRRRRISPAQDTLPDPVIGQVTLWGKFKCVDVACDDLTFGRQADFKRHYENVHSPNRPQYFCPVAGCSRSQHPQGGRSKGRSFNNRKDKMEEHVRTVHQMDESGSEVKTKGKRPRTKF